MESCLQGDGESSGCMCGYVNSSSTVVSGNCTLTPLPVIIGNRIDHFYFRGFGKGTPMYTVLVLAVGLVNSS